MRSKREPAEAVHLRPRAARDALDEAARAVQLARIDARRQAREQMQVLLGRCRRGGRCRAARRRRGAGRSPRASRAAPPRCGVSPAWMPPLGRSQWRWPVTWQSRSSRDSSSTTMPQLRRRGRAGRRSSIAHCRGAAARRACPASAGLRRAPPTPWRRRRSRRGAARDAPRRTHRRMAAPRSFALFATALGTCAIAWNDDRPDRRVAARSELPSRCARKVARRCAGAREAAPPGAVGRGGRRDHAPARRRARRPERHRARRRRHRRLRSPRLRRHARDRRRPRAHLRRGRGAGRRRRDGARGRPVARPQRDADRRAVPSRRRDRRRARRLLGARRHARPSAACWRSRTRASTAPPGPVRLRLGRAGDGRRRRAPSDREARRRAPDAGADVDSLGRRLDRRRRAARRCRSGSRSPGRAP